jgi:ABC-2 type transport system permease protein
MLTLRAEFQKLFTLRSTYAISILAFAATAALAFYLAGWHATPQDLHDPGFLESQAVGPLGIVVVFGALLGILVMTHEYRYHTIVYTLMSANSRSKVLMAKIAVVTAFAVAFTITVDALSLVASYLGARVAHGHALVPQTIEAGDLLWRTVVFGWGYAMAGLVLAVLIRHQVGTIVTVFLLFGPVEGILDAVLGRNALYLPFTAVGNVLKSKTINTALLPVPPARAALVFAADLAIAWMLAWMLFLRRDANS